MGGFLSFVGTVTAGVILFCIIAIVHSEARQNTLDRVYACVESNVDKETCYKINGWEEYLHK